MDKHIDKMEKDGCLYSVVEAFSVLDLSIKTYDSIKMAKLEESEERARKEARSAKILSIISFCVSTAIAIASLIVAIIK